MTTIAWDGKTLAADGLEIASGTILTRNCKKIYDIPGGWFAGAGSSSVLEQVVIWLRAGSPIDMKPIMEKDDKLDAILIRDGECFMLDKSLTPMPFPKSEPLTAGAGYEIALSALKLGKTAKEAIQLASKLNCYTGGKITSVKVYE